MPLLSDLRQRRREPEIMDQPGLDPARHRHALRGLGRINRWSASARILWPALRRLAQSRTEPLRVLDIATGGGDIPIRLWRHTKAGVPMRIEGCDISATALDYAREGAVQAGADVEFFRCDVLNEALPRRYDVATCSLFLHHLDEPEAITLLRRAADVVDQALLINDLRRSTLGLWFTQLGTRLLTTSPVVHVDGPLSVRAAFTPAEAAALARQAGLHNVKVVRKWPFRFLLSWYRSVNRQETR